MICSFIQLAILPIKDLICSQWSLTAITNSANPATTSDTTKGIQPPQTPKITSPNAVRREPIVRMIALIILKPFFHWSTKLITAVIAPPIVDATPAIVVATPPNAYTHAS